MSASIPLACRLFGDKVTKGIRCIEPIEGVHMDAQSINHVAAAAADRLKSR